MAKSNRDHALQLLSMATKDQTAVSKMQERSEFAEEIFGFHAQQSIEKSLKALIAILNLSYPKSHDISELLRILELAGVDLSGFADLESFSVYAVQYRYEAFDGDNEPLNRAGTVDMTAALLAHVRRVIDSA